MKIIKAEQLKKGNLFKLDDYGKSVHEFMFNARNAGGYGGKEGEGVTMYVITKTGFEVSFHQIYRKNDTKCFLFEKEDMKDLSDAEQRIRQTAHYCELYKVAEENSDGENLVGTYPDSCEYGKKAFSRGDIVRDCHGRIGIVLGVDGHSINFIKRVDYRVEVDDCGIKGTGIFRADEITKIGKMDDIKGLKE